MCKSAKLFLGILLLPLIVQVLYFLKTGHWLPVSLITVLQWVGCNWALTPNDWYGLWKVLNTIHLSILIIILFILIALIAAGIRKMLNGLWRA